MSNTYVNKSGIIIDKLFESRINESKIYKYIVTFSDRMGSHSRVLVSYRGTITPKKAEEFYKDYCNRNGCKFYSLENADSNSKMVKELEKDKRVDNI